jgi:hypothetical protein
MRFLQESHGVKSNKTTFITAFFVTATRYKVPEGMYHWYRRENVPEDSSLEPKVKYYS